MTAFSTINPNNGFYRSYLVRIWQSNEQGQWRASAQCVQTGNTILFGDVESLFHFLRTEIVPPSDAQKTSCTTVSPSLT